MDEGIPEQPRNDPPLSKPYLILEPNLPARDRLGQLLNGNRNVLVASAIADSERANYTIYDFSQRNEDEVSTLLSELEVSHRPAEILPIIQQFTNSPGSRSWQYQARVLRQRTDFQVLESVLRTVAPHKLQESLAADTASGDLAQVLDQYPWIRDQYASVGTDAFLQDVKRICAEHPLKVYLDRPHKDGNYWSVLEALVDRMLRRGIINQVPGRYFAFDENTLNQRVYERYAQKEGQTPFLFKADELRALAKSPNWSDILRALGGEYQKIREQLGEEEKARVQQHLQQHGIQGVLREEKRIPGASKNEVYRISFKVPEQTTFRAIAKIFDCRDDGAESKRKEFKNEVLAIRYFERLGLIDPIYFMEESINGISAIVMNYLPDENLLDVMKTANPDERLTLARQMVRKGAKFHAHGPVNLARKMVGGSVEDRLAHFAGRLTGQNAYFLPNILRLLKSQNITVENESLLESNIRNGMAPLLQFLAKTKDYDVPYCDLWIPNWFGIREANGFRITTKRDFGTLKYVPAPIDVVTVCAVADFVREGRETVYREHFNAYNHEVEKVNQLVKSCERQPRKMLMHQLRKDLKMNEHVPKDVIREIAELASSKTQRIKVYQEIIQPTMADHQGSDAVKSYLDDLWLYFDSLSEPRKPFENMEDYLFLCKVAEPKRAQVMAGFFADHAVRNGLSGEYLKYITTTLRNAAEPLETLADSEPFQKQKTDLHVAWQSLIELARLTDQLKPTMADEPPRQA
jgi:hypothetical protein